MHVSDVTIRQKNIQACSQPISPRGGAKNIVGAKKMTEFKT